MGSRAIKRRYGIKKRNGKTILLAVVSVIAAAIIAGVVGVAALCQTWLQDLPDYTNVEALNTAEPSRVYATNSETGEQVLLAEFQAVNREPVELSQISELVTKGTVATEDERFYAHNGVDIVGVGRALLNNFMGGDLEGASTITQQFVRNTILSDEMTDISFKRKIREMYLAYKLEEIYTKDEILLMYLNTINYGAGAYGIEAASERYFSKHATDLTLNEAATLIGIPQSPTYNDPRLNEDQSTKRRNVVLDRMVSNGVVTQEEADAVKAEPIMLNEKEPSETGIYAQPYFTSYVREQLLDPDGRYKFSVDEVFKGGLSVYTTLDLHAQEAAEAAAERKLDAVGHKFEVSLVALDPDNGHIKAMIGGKDYNATQVNMATGDGTNGRQCGSSFKFFTLVAALEAGIDPKTMIDASTWVDVPGSERVANDSFTNWGTIPISKAFAVSSNTAFIRLIMSVGVDEVIDVAEKLGMTADLPEVAGLTLGIASVTPLEMAQAYAVVANGGTLYKAECIERIEDASGNIIVDNSNPSGERVLSPEVSHAAVEVMKGVVTSGTGTAARLANGQEAAGKTGTTDEEKDSYFCGITPQYSVALWLGERAERYEDASPVYNPVASVFSDFLNQVLKGEPLEKFPKAADPPYKKNFVDEKNHIGGSYSNETGTISSSSSSAASSADSSASSSASSSDDATPPASGDAGGAEGGGTGGAAGGGDAGGGAGGGGAPAPDPAPAPASDQGRSAEPSPDPSS
ncbi:MULTISPECIES: transglycosylase domain-containing protein [unclassified Adlercreutzia]|uniref:transglycosylase domain-containing protein n=1 Tax=unclassified Adlercreutzia TaxID=2636013 RepID=UPI0019813CE6|nr:MULTISPECIES: transglycosylase domain-containing protein [unclassified Adlercreutzia]